MRNHCDCDRLSLASAIGGDVMSSTTVGRGVNPLGGLGREPWSQLCFCALGLQTPLGGAL